MQAHSKENLNDRCLQGPDLVNKLIHVLLRFRLHQYAIQADVEAMYNQIRIPPCDRDALRFLWYHENKLVHYRMTSHLFGGVWCSSSSTYALRRTVSDAKNVHPLVRDTIERSFYVDDCLKSVSQKGEAKIIIQKTPQVLQEGGFHLHKFVVNDRELLSDITVEHRAKEVREIGQEMSGKVLGIQWDITRDTFFFSVNNPADYVVTRRKMLSITSSIYDPLGFVGPVILSGKLLFQEATRLRLAWDDQVPSSIESKWSQWFASLSELSHFMVSRCVKPAEFDDAFIELHHFSDASQHAYGACTYMRCINKHGIVHTQLVVSKNKVAPLKACTIPRLELQGAVLAVKMDSLLRQELNLSINQSYFWTDSEVVLKYIRNETRRFHVFVANRVGLIRQSSSPNQWNYVKTNENPADMLTRCLPVSKLGDKWLQGPVWLRQYKCDWPEGKISNELSPDDPEVKCGVTDVMVHATCLQKHDPLRQIASHYSSWYKMQRALAWLCRLLIILKTKTPNRTPLAPSELDHAKITLIKHVQNLEFPDEVAKLQSGKSVNKSSCLSGLSPFLDALGVMRVGGRLSESNVASKHPYIIPHGHAIARAIILDVHNAAHVGVEWTASLVRQQYWIIKLRSAVKQIVRSCVTCRKLYARPCTQKMADLPTERIQPNMPCFSYVGIDVFGPYMVQQRRSQVKRYGCIMTCMVTRAVHLEKLESLDTDSFLNAFRRFINRRGSPLKVYSDNGTNLVSADKQMTESMGELSQKRIQQFASRQNIEWHFIPPHAAHMGGVWERMIGVAKRVLKAVLLNVKLTDEILETLFTEVESILNGRPLTKLSDDPNDHAPLTPNHLLLLRHGPTLPPGVFSQHDEYRRRWRHVQHLANMFWKKWIRLYLPLLQKRDKWIDVSRNVAAGDLVIIADENTPRNVWPLALVESVQQGRDGLVRSVKLRTRSTQLVRPITKIILLEGTK